MLNIGVLIATISLFLAYGRCDNAPSVIIVGAGAAGIAAATKLLENGINNITILEAEPRIGGRINSVKFEDAVIDLGAQWCHGEKDNIVFQLANDLNLLAPSNFNATFYVSSGNEVDQKFANELNELFQEIYNDDMSGEVSLGKYLTDKYNSIVREKYKNAPEKLKFAQDILSVFEVQVLSLEGSFSWFDPSAEKDYKACEGHQNLNWKGRGYKTILDILMKSYPDANKKLPIDDKILLNKEVAEIIWDSNSADSSTAAVKCSDKTEYSADHVIITVSLGVLKDQYDTLFYPSLTGAKINAIEELGIGGVMKVFLHFPTKWWSDVASNGMIFHWYKNDRVKLPLEFTQGPNDNGHSWLENFRFILGVDENPNVLTAWFVGHFVPQIELISDEILIEGILFALNKFVGHEFNITKPNHIARSKWYTNPHFRGVYSFETVQSRKRGISSASILSEPLTSSNGKQTLLFAGEATHPIHYASVHGAIETGHREANRIVRFYK